MPSAIKVFNWTATLYRGQITFEAPMLYALGFLGLFTMGGLTGLWLGVNAFGEDGFDELDELAEGYTNIDLGDPE